MTRKVKNDLPLNWARSTIGEACEVVLGQSPPSSTYNTDGIGLPFFQGKAEFGDMFPTAVKWCSEPNKIAEPGDVLISVRAPVGSTNLNREKSCIGRGLAAIRPRDGMSNLYFLYLLRHVESELVEKSTGTTFQAITGNVLRNQEVPLAPKDEQYRIVEEIEKQFTRLDAAVINLKRIQANLARYKASVLKAACEGRLVPQDPDDEPASELLARILAERRRKWEEAKPKKKYVEPEPPDTSELPELPAGWVYIGLESLLSIQRPGMKTGPFGSLLKKHEHRDVGVPVLGIENIQSMRFVRGSKIHISPKKAQELEAYDARPGDILVLGKLSYCSFTTG
jgi:type I restriction enzyme, S subunit